VSDFAECLTLGKEVVCQVSGFAESRTFGIEVLCRMPLFASVGKEVIFRVSVFAESPIFGPRQSLRHSAMAAFPVVNDDEMFGLLCFILMSAEDLKWLRDLFSSSEPYTKIFEVHCPVITIFYLKYPRIFVVLVGFI
jgi:hypothetical protein